MEMKMKAEVVKVKMEARTKVSVRVEVKAEVRVESGKWKRNRQIERRISCAFISMASLVGFSCLSQVRFKNALGHLALDLQTVLGYKR